MFAKIFAQIYDSSIVENADVRFTFMDMVVLADRNGGGGRYDARSDCAPDEPAG